MCVIVCVCVCVCVIVICVCVCVCEFLQFGGLGLEIGGVGLKFKMAKMEHSPNLRLLAYNHILVHHSVHIY